MMVTKQYVAEIKEVSNNSVLTSSYTGREMTREELIAFWGLDEPDVEWYRLYEIVDGHKAEI